MVEGKYESRDTSEHFRDLTNGDFYPLRVTADRLYLDTLYNYDTNQKVKLINSVYFGIDKLMVDDSYIGGARKVLEFMNLKKIWKFHQDQSWYQIGDAKPVIIFELQMQESGIFIKRFAYNIAQVLALVGGLQKGVFIAMAIISSFFRRTEAMSQVI